jgi:hypothetical protein
MMTNIYELFKELDEKLQERDINSEPFNYMTNGNDELIRYFGETVLSSSDSWYDKLQMLEIIKSNIEDMIFNCKIVLCAIETIRKEV